MTVNAFLLMWNQYGLEGCKAITEYEQLDKENVVRILKGHNTQRNPLDGILRSWVLRSRFNPHRNYEVWAIDCSDPHITEEDWYKWFDANPQHAADLVRSKGVCYYGKPGVAQEVKIR